MFCQVAIDFFIFYSYFQHNLFFGAAAFTMPIDTFTIVIFSGVARGE